jgi:hypothetical protein
VAESTGVEVFDEKGSLQRTLELKDDRAAVSMAAVPRGSSLFLGQGATESTGPVGTSAPNLATPEPPTTSTIVEAAKSIVGSPPVQGAGLVAALILVACWWVIRWYDRRAGRRAPRHR